MTQKNIKIFINEIYSKPPKKNYVTNKTDVYYIDDIWSSDILDLKDYDPKKNRGFIYVLVIIDNFSKFGWTTPLKNENAQTIKDCFQKVLISSKEKPGSIEIVVAFCGVRFRMRTILGIVLIRSLACI